MVALVQFATPALLALLPLALLPLLVHLLYKRRRATIELPSLRLLRDVELRLAPRRRLREILLLAARCLFLAALVLAVARPVSSVGAGGAASATDYVVVLDNTASMQLEDQAAPAFEIARRRAAEILDAAGSRDRVALLPSVEPDGWEAGALTADRALLRRALDGLACSDATADPGRAVERALGLALESVAPRREVCVLSDFRGPAGRLDAAALGAVRARGARVGFLLVDCATPDPGPNATLELLSVEPVAPLVGRPVEVAVRVTNDSAGEIVCGVALELGGAPLDTVAVTVPAEGSTVRRVTIPRVPQVGWTAGRVSLPGDGFRPDDEAGFVLAVRERLRVLVADPALDAPYPDPEAAGRFLARLLDPSGDGGTSGIAVERVRPADARARLLAGGADALLVCGYGALDGVGPDTAERFAGQGGFVAVFADEGAGAGAPWLAARPVGSVEAPEPAGGVRLPAAPEGDGALRDLGVRLRLPLEPRAGAEVVLAFDSGRPALAVAPVGNGAAASAGFSLAPAWGGFTFHPEIVALLHRLVARYAGPPRIVAAVAGGAVRVPCPEGAAPAHVTRAGEVLGERRVRASAEQGDAYDLGRCLRAGIYALETDAEVQRYVAVLPAVDESRLARGTPAAGYGDGEIVGLDADLSAFLRDRRVGRDYAPGLLLAALALALLEALLANRISRAPRRAPAVTSSRMAEEAVA